MILLKIKPLFTPFEIYMLIFLAICIVVWVWINIHNGRQENKYNKTVKDYRSKLKIVDNYDSAMSTDNNQTFKN